MARVRLEDIEHELNGVNRDRWSAQHLEFQDNQELVFVSVTVATGTSAAEIEGIRADIRAVLKRLVPPRPSNYSWTAVVKKGNKVVESLMGGALRDLPEI